MTVGGTERLDRTIRRLQFQLQRLLVRFDVGLRERPDAAREFVFLWEIDRTHDSS